MLRGNLRRALTLARLRTHRGEPLAVTLYERQGCHLCEETHRALRRIGLDQPLDVRRVDITTEPELERRYVLRIPVLRVEERELDAANFTDRDLLAWLSADA